MKRYWRSPILLPTIALWQFAAIIIYLIDILIILYRLFGIKIIGFPSETIAMIIFIPISMITYYYLTGGDRLEKTIAEFESETEKEKRKWRIISVIFVNLPFLVLIILLFTGIKS